MTKIKLTPFHLAIQVRNIDEARQFYGEVLGLSEGRSTNQWIDFNLFGHQIVTHLNPNIGEHGQVPEISNPVDSKAVPVPHFGVILERADWQSLADRVKEHINAFIIEPYIRFEGEVGEQGTFFFKDPSGNALEFKTFKDIDQQLFAQ